MIKLIALLTMLIDHIGMVCFPDEITFRMIGRLSMPLFAYGIAKGFCISQKHHTLNKYLIRMLLFSLVSQIPYYLIEGKGLNIGFTWLVSLLWMVVLFKEKPEKPIEIVARIIITVIATYVLYSQVVPINYGLYGVVLPILFYLLIKTSKENLATYTLVLAVSVIYYIFIEHGSLLQILSIFSAFILAVNKKNEINFKLPKLAGYGFYPIHLFILFIVKHFI